MNKWFQLFRNKLRWTRMIWNELKENEWTWFNMITDLNWNELTKSKVSWHEVKRIADVSWNESNLVEKYLNELKRLNRHESTWVAILAKQDAYSFSCCYTILEVLYPTENYMSSQELLYKFFVSSALQTAPNLKNHQKMAKTMPEIANRIIDIPC